MGKLNIHDCRLGLCIPEGLLTENLSTRALLVYGRLAHYAYIGDGSICWPSHETLSHDLDVSKDSVKRGIKELLKKKLIRITHPTGEDIAKHQHNTYTLCAHKSINTEEQKHAEKGDANLHRGGCKSAPRGGCKSAPSSSSNNTTYYSYYNKQVRNKENTSRARTRASELSGGLSLDMDGVEAGYTETPEQKQKGYSPEFEDAWGSYAKKQDKARAWKEWNKLDEGDREDATSAIEAYVASTPNKKWRKKFCHYLRDRVWEDEEFDTPDQEEPIEQIELSTTGEKLCNYIRKTMEAVHSRQMDEEDMVPIRKLAHRLDTIIKRQRWIAQTRWMNWEGVEFDGTLTCEFCEFVEEWGAVHPNALLPDTGAAWKAFWKEKWAHNETEAVPFASYQAMMKAIEA